MIQVVDGSSNPSKPRQFEPGDHRKDSGAFSQKAIAELKPRLQTLKARFGSTTEDLASVALNHIWLSRGCRVTFLDSATSAKPAAIWRRRGDR